MSVCCVWLLVDELLWGLCWDGWARLLHWVLVLCPWHLPPRGKRLLPMLYQGWVWWKLPVHWGCVLCPWMAGGMVKEPEMILIYSFMISSILILRFKKKAVRGALPIFGIWHHKNIFICICFFKCLIFSLVCVLFNSFPLYISWICLYF